MIIRKSAAEIEGMERAGQLVAATIALLGEHAQPGITTGELDQLADDSFASTAVSRPPWATAVSLQRHASRRMRWSSMASPVATVSRRATSSPWTSVSPSTGWLRTAPTRTRSERSIPRLSGCSTSARRRSQPGSTRRARATASATSHMPSSWSWKVPASRSCAPWSATGSAAPTTRSLRSRTSASPAGARSSRPA